MIELKPCPFCGRKPKTSDLHLHQISCKYSKCSAHPCVIKETLEEAIKAWNTRDPGWIPCSERIPKVRTDVLIMFEENMCVGFYSRGSWNVNSGNGFYTAILASEDQPEAWAPLPEQPEGGAEK